MKTGQILIEVVVAVAVAIVAVVALVGLSNRASSTAGVSKRQVEATSLATEGMEWIRETKAIGSWSSLFGLSGRYCLSSVASGLTAMGGGCSVVGTTEYTRTAVFYPTPGPPQQMLVAVEVAWNEGTRVFESRQETIFSQY